MAPTPRYRPGMGDPSTDADRRRVLDAARSVLAEGSDMIELPMDVIAARAGVARTIVHRQFYGAAGLLEALYDHLIEASALARIASTFELEDRARTLESFVTAFAALWEGERVTIRRLRAFATFDIALGKALQKREEYRRKMVQALVRRLDPAAGEPDARKVDVVATLTSFEVLDALAGTTRIDGVVPLVVTLIESSLEGLDERAARH